MKSSAQEHYNIKNMHAAERQSEITRENSTKV
jgi:hypothetical protein